MVLVDTNILLRSLHPNHLLYDAAKQALRILWNRKEALCITPQNIVEFWAVATRPLDENGLEMSFRQVEEGIVELRALFRLLAYTPEVLETWLRIVAANHVIGKQTHDAHLVAAMKVHSVSQILTFNTGHFERYAGITALNPAQI